jgi:hypothetical protein
MPASPQDWACRLPAATRFQRPTDRRVGKAKYAHRSGIPPYGPSLRGDGAPKSAKPYGSCLAARGRLAARQSRHLLGSGPRFSPVCTHLRVGRAFSQLLAGTPSGPGRSSAAARVPRCDEARGRRTSSRLTTPHDRAPQWTRWVDDKRRLKGGDKPGTALPLAPYLPLVGRSGVALLCRATASLLERESATLGWGDSSHPTRRA